MVGIEIDLVIENSFMDWVGFYNYHYCVYSVFKLYIFEVKQISLQHQKDKIFLFLLSVLLASNN